MRIVDVCAFLSPRGGGVKTYIEQKLRFAPMLGHDITVIAPGDDNAVTEFGTNARIITLPAPRFPLDRNYWYFDNEAALHAALDRAEPDLVEASSPWRSASMVARWQSNVPKALVMHADPLSAYAYRWFEPLLSRESIDRSFEPFWSHLRGLSHRYDRVVCASQELKNRLAAGGVANTALHPMGVEANLFSPQRRDPAMRAQLLEMCGLPEDAHLLLGIGRLSAEKRWPMMIDAVTAAGQHLPIGFVILGAGKKRAQIQRQIAGNPHIRLLPPIRNRQAFAALLASGDALVHGCEAETFCMAAAEARASGVPVIVPDRGGASDHARNGGGRTYRSGSAIHATRAIISQFHADIPLTASTHVRTMEAHFHALFADYEELRLGSRRAA